MLLASHTTLQGDLERGAVLVAITTSLLLLTALMRAPLTTLNDWLVHRAAWLVG
jgi:hypothetical protein